MGSENSAERSAKCALRRGWNVKRRAGLPVTAAMDRRLAQVVRVVRRRRRQIRRLAVVAADAELARRRHHVVDVARERRRRLVHVRLGVVDGMRLALGRLAVGVLVDAVGAGVGRRRRHAVGNVLQAGGHARFGVVDARHHPHQRLRVVRRLAAGPVAAVRPRRHLARPRLRQVLARLARRILEYQVVVFDENLDDHVVELDVEYGGERFFGGPQQRRPEHHAQIEHGHFVFMAFH